MKPRQLFQEGGAMCLAREVHKANVPAEAEDLVKSILPVAALTAQQANDIIEADDPLAKARELGYPIKEGSTLVTSNSEPKVLAVRLATGELIGSAEAEGLDGEEIFTGKWKPGVEVDKEYSGYELARVLSGAVHGVCFSKSDRAVKITCIGHGGSFSINTTA